MYVLTSRNSAKSERSEIQPTKKASGGIDRLSPLCRR